MRPGVSQPSGFRTPRVNVNRTSWTVSLLGILLLALHNPALAQPFSLDFRDEPLESALAILDQQASESLVFASRLVRNQSVTCLYQGANFHDALDCVLAGTGLVAQRIRRNQYVITAGGSADSGAKNSRRSSIAGFVVDGETEEVLPGAHVYLADLQSGVVTNNSGYFSLSSLPPGEYRARISYVGYETVEVYLKTGASTEIRLRPAELSSVQIVVEGEQTAPTVALPGLLAIPVQQLEALPSFPGEQDLLQALQWLPGVRKSGEISGGLLIRGGEPDQNLYLLEGVPIYHPWHAFSLISTFQTETFKSVRLYRGTFPAEYGGRLSSVLDVQMKDGARKEPSATVGISLVSGRFVVESPVGKKSSMMISARRSYLDQILGREHPVESQDGRMDTLRTGYYFFDVRTTWTYRPSHRHQLSLAYYEGTDDLDLRLPFDLSLTPGSWLRPADLFFEIDQAWGNRAVSLKHNFLASQDLFVSSTAYYSAYGANERAFIRPTSSSSVASSYDVRLDEVGLKVDVDRYHSIAHQFRGGVQLVRRDFRGGLDASINPTPGSADELAQSSQLTGWEAAAYLEDNWKPTVDWDVTLGLRGSYFAAGQYFNLSPSVAAAYQLRPALSLRASASTQVQYMHRLRDRYSFMYDLVSSRWIPATADVSPSHSAQVSAGAETVLMPGLVVTGDVYFRRSYDILVPEDAYRTKDGLEGPGIEVGALLGQYSRADGRAYGVEVGVRLDRELWDLYVSYSGGRTLVRVPERAEGFNPSRYDVPRSLRAVAAIQPGDWHLAVSADVRSGYPYTIPEARYAIADPLDEEPVNYLYRPSLNNGRLPPYGRLDLTVGYRFNFLKGRWQAKLHVYNALNHRNVIARDFDPSGRIVDVTDRRGLPLLPLLEIEVEI